MGNCIVNVLLGVVLGARMEEAFANVLLPPSVAHPVVSYAVAVFLTTGALVIVGEITPKVVVIGHGRGFVRFAAIPIYLIDRILLPVRRGLIAFVGFLFRVTRFSQLPPAPFMTDDEFKVLLSQGEASGAIEEDERQMIQGILEFSDVMLREILVPRPDMLVLSDRATVGEALDLVRKEEPSRIPVYGDSLDHIQGILFAKDLLPYVISGSLDQPIHPLLRKAHFVPETMTVAEFVKTAQHLHTHLAIVADEFGGTEGLVTLQDALREVVGDIDEEEPPAYVREGEGVFCVEGSLPLDEMESLIGNPVEAEEHTTVAGFLMEKTDKLPEVGDRIEDSGVLYTIEALDGKRVSRVRIEVPTAGQEGAES